MENQLEPQIAKLETRPNPGQNMTAVAKGGGIVFSGKLFLDAVRFATALVLARLLGAENYGMYSLALSATNIGVGVALLGLDAGLTRYVAVMVGRKDEESVWGTIQVGVSAAMLLSALSGTALFAFAYFVAENAFRQASLAPLLQLAAVLIPVLTLSEVLASTIKGFRRMDYPVIAQFVVQPLIRLILIVILALTRFNSFLAIVTFGVADLLASGLMVYYLNKTFPLKRDGFFPAGLDVWPDGSIPG
jgi:O-antigen/teichoic acid export membrane protein